MEKLQILIADDEQDLLSTMATILIIDGYDVTSASNGLVALEKIKSSLEADHRPFDILITDIEMPSMGGKELIESARKLIPDLPVLAITGFGTKKTVVDLMRTGVADYIDKPFQMRTLSERVSTLARTARTVREAHSLEERLRGELIGAYHATIEQRLNVSQKFETLGRIASGIVHDVNNLVGVARGYSEMIRTESLSSTFIMKAADVSTWAKNAMNACDGIATTLMQVQQFNRGIQEDFTFFALHEAIEDSLKLAKGLLRSGIEVQTRFASNIDLINGSRTFIINALINLYLNARDAMPKGGKLIITSELLEHCDQIPNGQDKQCIRIRVVDTGEGMSQVIKDRIFEPFFTTKGEKGNGLGLSGVLSTMSRHGGIVTVSSEEGKGSTFTLTFPLVVIAE